MQDDQQKKKQPASWLDLPAPPMPKLTGSERGEQNLYDPYIM